MPETDGAQGEREERKESREVRKGAVAVVRHPPFFSLVDFQILRAKNIVVHKLEYRHVEPAGKFVHG